MCDWACGEYIIITMRISVCLTLHQLPKCANIHDERFFKGYNWDHCTAMTNQDTFDKLQYAVSIILNYGYHYFHSHWASESDQCVIWSVTWTQRFLKNNHVLFVTKQNKSHTLLVTHSHWLKMHNTLLVRLYCEKECAFWPDHACHYHIHREKQCIAVIFYNLGSG